MQANGAVMSLMGTLAKVAIGAAVAKGVGSVMVSKAGATAGSGDLSGGAQSSQRSGGGLGDLMGEVLGGRQAPTRPAGSAGAAETGGGGSSGDLLNQSFGNRGERDATSTPAQHAVAGLMPKAMIHAAKADGRIDADEQKKRLGNLGEVSAAKNRFVEAEMTAPIDVEGLARQVPRGLEAQVCMMSLMAIDRDNRTEATYLHQLATALGLDKPRVNQIHAKEGAPALYA